MPVTCPSWSELPAQAAGPSWIPRQHQHHFWPSRPWVLLIVLSVTSYPRTKGPLPDLLGFLLSSGWLCAVTQAGLCGHLTLRGKNTNALVHREWATCAAGDSTGGRAELTVGSRRVVGLEMLPRAQPCSHCSLELHKAQTQQGSRGCC